MMTEIEIDIVYTEGFDAYQDGINLINCPYVGVSEELTNIWETGWWDNFYKD